MRFALVNPHWTFEGSIYFGCREPHLPLEYGYAKALLEARGHEVLLLDATLFPTGLDGIRARLAEFRPDLTVVTSAPSYLFWRCPPPELRVPRQTIAALREVAGTVVLVGPHGSTTPAAALRKSGADVVVLGECEEVLPRLAREGLKTTGIAYRRGAEVVVQGGPQAADMAALPALHWPREFLHPHHHHRFDEPRKGLGAELEASRGCPYSCTFCAKENYRDRYRRRPLEKVVKELDDLIAKGAGYVYFVDEIFLPDRKLLEALREREIRFGVQTRIDLWKPEMLELMGEAGCVSIEAGVESISELGRMLLNKNCRMGAEQLKERLVHARRSVPFVQATLLDSQVDDSDAVTRWRQELITEGVWANEPVPLFPYPGSSSYTALWGPPDDHAWERAHEHYLSLFDRFSDIQEEHPLPLPQLEILPTPGKGG